MKWLFSILLIANLGMFIWLFPQHNGQSSERSSHENVGQLWLVGERERAPAAEASGPGGRLAESPAQGEPAAQPSTVSEATVESPRIPVDEPPPLVASGDKAAELSPIEPATQCGDVGYFDKRSQAELLSVKMLAQGVKTEIASEQSNEQAGYWVLIPPQQDREDAVEIAKQLDAAGVADIWRFTSGELAHAISLGLFRDEERAIARRDQIAGMGFNTEVRPRYREKTQYWLSYKYTGEAPLSDDFWREVDREFTDLQRNEKPCP